MTSKQVRVRSAEDVRRHAGDPAECWTAFPGARVSDRGYLQKHAFGRLWQFHRLAYTLLVEPVDAALDLDHLCRVKTCWNPAHLEPVPHALNIYRGEAPTATNASKLYCDRGHPLFGATLVLRSDGGRRCRTCQIEVRRVLRRQRGVSERRILSSEERQSIAAAKASGESPHSIAERFDIAASTVRKVTRDVLDPSVVERRRERNRVNEAMKRRAAVAS